MTLLYRISEFNQRKKRTKKKKSYFLLTKANVISYLEVMKEVTIVLKDSERTYRQKFLIYDEMQASEHDAIIVGCIESAKKNFEGEPEIIQVRIHIEL